MRFARIHRAHAELHTLLQPVLLPCFQLLNDNVNIGKGSYCCCCCSTEHFSVCCDDAKSVESGSELFPMRKCLDIFLCFESQTFVHHVLPDWTWESEDITATLLNSGIRYLVSGHFLVAYLRWKRA
jgi:hypothetical protein